jgi:hypothetical protein
MAGGDETGRPPVSIDTLSSLPPVEIPDSGAQSLGKKEGEYLAHEQEYFKKELGWLGKPFGGKNEKPGNISALVIVFCFLAMGAVYFSPPKDLGPVISVERIFSGLTSLVTLILGYLFGSSDKNSK